MEMQDFVESFALPLLRKRHGARVCEIGSRLGGSATALASLSHTEVTVIDPCLDCDLDQKFARNTRVTVKKDISLKVLPDLNDPFDCILIDGDHNWYTVYNELKLIYERKLLRDHGVVFLHDVEWPWGRRDMYYQPETIPSEYRHEWERKGIVRGNSRLLQSGGMFPSYNKAISEGGPRNGVLTAVEDFLREHKDEYHFFLVHDGVGLGVIYRKGNFKDELELLPLKCRGLLCNVVDRPKSFLRDHFPALFRELKTLLTHTSPREFLLPGVAFLILMVVGYLIVTSLLR